MRADSETGVERTSTSGLGVLERIVMRKKISQAEARRLKRRYTELEDKIKSEWNGVRIQSWTLADVDFARVKTAWVLGHPLVMYPTGSGNEVKLMAKTL